jgi:hypothetical protein
VRVGILLASGKHLHDRIMPLRKEVCVHKTSLIPPLCIAVPVPSQESQQSYICVLRVSILHVSTIFRLLWYFFFFHFIQTYLKYKDRIYFCGRTKLESFWCNNMSYVYSLLNYHVGLLNKSHTNLIHGNNSHNMKS